MTKKVVEPGFGRRPVTSSRSQKGRASCAETIEKGQKHRVTEKGENLMRKNRDFPRNSSAVGLAGQPSVGKG